MKFRESLATFTDQLPISGGPDLDKYKRDAPLPLDNLPSNSEPPYIPTKLKLEEEMVVAATQDLLTTAEAIRTGEILPTADTLRRLGYDAILLSRTELITPIHIVDTLAVTTADLHAAEADQEGDGLLVATLFNQALDAALPKANIDPRQSMEAQAYRGAITRTTPTHSFEAAHEEEWIRITGEEGYKRYPIELNGVGYSRLVPPPPKSPSLDPVPWWKLKKLLLIKRLARKDRQKKN